jgi:ribosomal protein S27E
VHQGHVLEFADGKLDTAKKPLPKPPKPEKKKEKPSVEGEVSVATETAPQAEVAIEPATEIPVSVGVPESEMAATVKPSEEIPEPKIPQSKYPPVKCPRCGNMVKSWEIDEHEVQCRYKAEGPAMPKPPLPDNHGEVKEVIRSEIIDRISSTRGGQQ